MNKIITLIILSLFISIYTITASSIDSSYTEGLKAYHWTAISDVEKTMQYENQKELTKRAIDQAKLAAEHYKSGVNLMKNKEFIAAITEFKAAMKRYKRAKLSPDALNFIHTNMALSYAKSGNKDDLSTANRLLSLITNRAYNDNKWTYNIAIAHYLVGNQNEAASLLSSIIRKDEYFFQAYITLEDIYRNSGNTSDAKKVIARMETAENKLRKKNQKIKQKKSEIKTERKNTKKTISAKGKRPDIKNLKILKNDNHMQFNKIKQIDERSMVQIQEGISTYNIGVNSLSKKEYKAAQDYLKDAEKRLKRGKITDDGLNYVRGNLAIAYLATEEKRGIGQAKRYLRPITSKLFKTREWTYNMAVVYYQFAYMSARENKKDGTRKWKTTAAAENISKSIKLFQQVIKQDKLFLTAYENLIYIYKEQNEYTKADKVVKAAKKVRLKLMESFTKEDQLAKGLSAAIFRVNLGTFGNFDTPAKIDYEPNVITIPISEYKTTYLAGLFYSLEEAIEYKKKMNEKGYSKAYIVAYKDGEEIEFEK